MPLRAEKTYPSNQELLWRNFKAGDLSALEIIYRTNISSLIHYGLKINPDTEAVKDALHDLFVELWKSRENLSCTTNINFYLVKALRNKLLKYRSRIISVSDLGSINEFADRDAYPFFHQFEMAAISEQQINKAIKKIPDRQQDIIYLRFFYGYSNSQIAELLNIKVQSVSNLLHRALLSLKVRLQPLKKIAIELASLPFLLFL